MGKKEIANVLYIEAFSHLSNIRVMEMLLFYYSVCL